MPNEGFASISASILTDLSKGGLSGSLNYNPVSTDKWVYTERLISTASEPLIPSTQPYIEKYSNTGAQTTVAATDQYRWLAIKNTGTSDGSTASTEGIVISFTGDTATYQVPEGIFIDAGDLWIGKFPSTTEQRDIYAISVAVTNGSPSGAGSGTVLCQIAAILDDIA